MKLEQLMVAMVYVKDIILSSFSSIRPVDILALFVMFIYFDLSNSVSF